MSNARDCWKEVGMNYGQTVALTLDQDWAPDWAMRYVIEALVEYQVKATWFITNECESLSLLREHADLFELGIHPNFAPNSTHGSTPSEVLAHCMKIVPEATVMRAHGLFLSSAILIIVMQDTSLMADFSTFMPKSPRQLPARLQWADRTLWKVPYFWEDDVEFSLSEPKWSLDEHLQFEEGVAIFNFHPIHICMDTQTIGQYTECREKLDVFSRVSMGKEYEPRGSQAIFNDLLEFLRGKGSTASQLLAEVTNQ